MHFLAPFIRGAEDDEDAAIEIARQGTGPHGAPVVGPVVRVHRPVQEENPSMKFAVEHVILLSTKPGPASSRK